MIIRYFAEDGMEFDSKEECFEYEQKQKKLKSLELPCMWDEDEKLTNDIAKAYYIKITNEKQAELFYLKSVEIGLAYPNDLYEYNEQEKQVFKTGSWLYDVGCDGWVNIKKMIEKLKKYL